jgi:hypothetical protein
MAKKKKKEKILTKKQIARGKKVQRQQRLIFAGLGIVAVLVVGILAFGLYSELVLKPASPVAVVNGTPIRTTEYQKRVRYRRFLLYSDLEEGRQALAQFDSEDEKMQPVIDYYQRNIQQLEASLSTVGLDVLDELIDGELVRQEAVARELTVTSEEVGKSILEQFGYRPERPTPTPTPITATVPITATAAPTPSPTPSKEQAQKSYQDYLAVLQTAAGFTDEDYRKLVEVNLFYKKLQQALADELPTTAEQVHAYHILVEEEEEALDVMTRLEEGEDFAALAEEVSVDPGTKDKGGDLGWFPRGVMIGPFEEAAFALQAGEMVTAPVQTQFGYHIIRVEEREQDRELEPSTLTARRNRALSDWLEEARQTANIENFWTPDKVPRDEIAARALR